MGDGGVCEYLERERDKGEGGASSEVRRRSVSRICHIIS